MCSSHKQTGNSSEKVQESFSFEQKYFFLLDEYFNFEPHQGHLSNGIFVLFSPSSLLFHLIDSSSKSFSLLGKELAPTYNPIEIASLPRLNSC